MRILFGTSNPAKLNSARNAVEGLDIEIISLNDISKEIPEVEEHGNSPLENAAEKALAYYEAFKMPVFSVDNGLFFENLPEYSPGIHIRTVGGKRLSDDEMIDYYGGLAAKYGDITAQYRNAVCLVMDWDRIFTDTSDDLNGRRFIITSQPCHERKEGFPLDSLTKEIIGGDKVGNNSDGFRRFFEEILEMI